MRDRSLAKVCSWAVLWIASIVLILGACSNSDDTSDGGAGASAHAGASAGEAGSSAGASGGVSAGANAASGNGGASGTGSVAGSSGAAGNAGSAGSAGTAAGQGAGGTTAAGGCESNGMQYIEGETGIPAPDGCNTCRCSGGELACTRIACPTPNLDECVTALRLDTCCDQYVPVTRAALAADECLSEYGQVIDGDKRTACYPAGQCLSVLCAPEAVGTFSRVSQLSESTGECFFADECSAPEDCVLANDFNRCCSCFESLPVALAQALACWTIEGQQSLVMSPCTGCQSDIACAGCPVPPEPTCEVRDIFSVCR